MTAEHTPHSISQTDMATALRDARLYLAGESIAVGRHDAVAHLFARALVGLEEQLREEQRAFRAYKEHVKRCVEEFAEEVRP